MTLEELVVTLKLDSSGFTKGQKDALDSFKKTNDEMTDRQKKLEATNEAVNQSFQDVATTIIGLAGVFGGAGMAAFAKDTVNSVAATGRLASNIGEITSELSTFGRVVARNGGNAEIAMGSMKGLSDQLTRLRTLGQGSNDLFSFLGTIGSQEKDSPLETFMRFAEWAEKHKDQPQLVNLLGQQGGLSQDAINEARKGLAQVRRDFAEASKGAVTGDQVEALTKLQGAWVGLDQAIEKTGRDIVTDAAPALTSIASGISGWIERNQKLADGIGEIGAAITALGALKPVGWVLRLLGLSGAAGVAEAGAAASFPLAVAGGTILAARDGVKKYGPFGVPYEYSKKYMEPASGGARAAGGRSNPAEREAHIRAAAVSLGIDPDVAMAVARSEGFNNFTGDNGTSFGDFQLHVTPGGRGGAVGDQFKKWTGLDPSDTANEQQADKFALQWAQNNGWHDFHGARRAGLDDHAGIAEVTINVHTDSKDPREHGRVAADAFKSRVNNDIATQANTGLN